MAEKQGNWGGARVGAGAKPKWQHSKEGTKLVRIPIAIESQVLEAARVIDAGIRLIPADPLQENVTNSRYNELVTKSNSSSGQRELEYLRQECERLKEQNRFLEEANADYIRQKVDWYECLQERPKLQEQLQRLQQEKKACQASSVSQPDLEDSRNRYLASLRLGKQAPEYKRVKKILDSFIAFIQSA